MSIESLTPYSEALRLINALGLNCNLETEQVALSQAYGRVLSEDLRSPEFHPPWNCSAMDGFAYANKDYSEKQNEFTVLGTLAAGDQPVTRAAAAPRPCWEIMTGAPLPSDCDTVIKIEDCKVIRNANGDAQSVKFLSGARPGQNVRQQGEDFSPSTVFLRAGLSLGPNDLLCCATLGLTQIPVYQKLRVGIVSTGSELVEVGVAIRPGQIRNSSRVFLQQDLSRYPVEVVDFGIVTDDPGQFKEVLTRAKAQAIDVMLSTGAVSMGKFDFVTQALHDEGARFHIKKVKVRPAKPLVVAEIENKKSRMLFFGLPGQPISTAVALKFFVAPYLRATTRAAEPESLCLPLKQELRKPQDHVCFFRGWIETTDGVSKVILHKQQQPSMLSPLAQCSCWIETEGAPDLIPAGAPVKVHFFNS